MRIGINGNHLVADQPYERLIGHVKSAADDGLDSYWMAQHPLGGKDALTTALMAAPHAPGIEIGTSVLPAYPRHPVALASQAATVDAAIGGRLTLGVGLSHRDWMESLGYSYARPAEFMREYLSILVPLLDSGEVDFRGKILSCTTRLGLPEPRRPIPVLLGALGPRMLELAGRLAAGTSAVWVGPRILREHLVPAIRRAAEAAGRPPPRIVVTLPVCVTSNSAGAAERARRDFAERGQLPSYRRNCEREGVDSPAAMSIIGGEGEVEDRIRELGRLGATDFGSSTFDWTQEEEARTRELLKRLAG